MSSKNDVAGLREDLTRVDWPSALALATQQWRSVFTTSFGLEDQAILHAIAQARLPVRMATLDTGRLFEETHKVHAESLQRYGLPIEVYAPDPVALRSLVTLIGPNGFYDSIDNRHACCQVRKVQPLRLALAGAELWITGIRREQSDDRAALEPVEWDAGQGLLKFHPLLDVSESELRRYIADNNVPINPLHDRGYPSIGCAPCTRAVQPGEPARRGRWWWEDDAQKECGLHLQDGRLVRSKGQGT
jgi:phosphoadenosine phosphosulfate reductase